MKKLLYSALGSVTVVLFLSFTLTAQEYTAEEILDNVENSIEATSAELTIDLTLYSASGSQRNRQLEVFMKEDGDLNKSYMRFTAPADIEGTAFLSLEQSNGDDEMYLYMPVLGSVRRIAGSQKSGSFVGTDFTYNDMTILGGGNYGEDYEATILEQSADEYVLRMDPLDDDISYHHTVMRVPSSNWFPTEIEFYEDSETVEKRLTNEQIEQVNGNWIARTITMEDVQNGTRTVLRLDEVQYDVSIDDQVFTTRYLERQR